MISIYVFLKGNPLLMVFIWNAWKVTKPKEFNLIYFTSSFWVLFNSSYESFLQEENNTISYFVSLSF